MFIIDFDDTLFDTHALKQAQAVVLEETGVSKEDCEWSYQAARSASDGQFTYTNDRRARLLETRGYNGDKIRNGLEETLTPTALRAGVLPGAIELLTYLRSRGQSLILLSLGDPNFQELKVKGCGLATYFDRLFMVSEKKETVIAEMITHHQPEDYWLLNDKIDESVSLSKMFPNMRIVLKHSPRYTETDYEVTGWPHFSHLSEIQSYFITHYGE